MDEKSFVINMPNNFKTPDDMTLEEFEGKRIIYLTSYVDETLLEIHRAILKWNLEDRDVPPEQRKPIWILIFSYGGDVDYMWMLIDAIMTSETPVYAVNIGVAASAAALIFISAKKRFMTEHANVMIHEGSASMSGDASKVFDASDSYKKAVKMMKEHILACTKIPSSLLNKKRNNDWNIDAQFCLENGVCDEVIRSVKEIM